MSIDLRYVSVLIMGGILLGFLGGCESNTEVSATESARSNEPAVQSADAGHQPSDTHPAATDATPPRDTAAAPADAEVVVIFADCHAPHRWTWGWTLNVEPGGEAEVQLKPDAYGEEVFEEFKINPEQMQSILKAAAKADFFKLEKHYGQAEGPVTRTLRLKIGDREHETSFTARHTQLDGVPVPLLELWCQIRETFSTYRAHNGAEYIRQYLENQGNE